MKAKTIKAVLRKTFDEFTASIEDKDLRDMVAKNGIITGGAIASMLLGEPVNDFDVYLKNHETALTIAKYYVSKFNIKNHKGIPCNITVMDEANRIKIVIKSAGVASEDGTDKPYEYFEGRPENEDGAYIGEVMTDPGDIEEAYQDTEQASLQTEDDGKPPFRPVFMSTNAITLSRRIQIVLRFFGSPDSIHENYDFVHCTNYWTSWDSELVLRQPALESLLARELRYVGSKYPVCSVIRLRKFLSRGWRVNAGQILKMMMQISELDLTDLKVLEDQLTGVDAAYFCRLMNKLKDKDPERINAAYLVEIIDRMF
jgi:hypothetical protein